MIALTYSNKNYLIKQFYETIFSFTRHSHIYKFYMLYENDHVEPLLDIPPPLELYYAVINI